MCRAEAPHLSELQKKHRDSGLVVLGINIDNDSPERLKKFVGEKGLAYQMLLRGEGVANRDYHCRAFPALYWIDREGKVIARDYGYKSPKYLEDRTKALIGR
jgi:thiol-disulfide isomerase/thioredoxin